MFNSLSTWDEVGSAIDNVVEAINDNGGFTVVGWYKRGKIEDQSNESNEDRDKVEAGEISFHVISVQPTSCERDVYQGLKFNVNVLSSA